MTNTYYVPSEGSPIGMQPGAIKYHIGYYQWVPVVLLVQAFFFYAPCLAWRVFSERSGININNLVEAADTIQNALYPERREKTIKCAMLIVGPILCRGVATGGISVSPNKKSVYLIHFYVVTLCFFSV